MQSSMVDNINEITNQARQGSVAAIIQLLNENLIISGVRTRAIFTDGVLQLLCEGSTVQQLEQSILVPKIQEILELIAPYNIYKVNINCRIVREEQILWLEEIKRDPENQLLWLQEIVIRQPNFWQRGQIFIENMIKSQSDKITDKSKLPKLQSFVIDNKTKQEGLQIFKTLVIGVSGLSLLMIFAWVITSGLNHKVVNLPSAKNTNVNPTLHHHVSNDHFASAVRLANQATANGRIAMTRTQWLEVAAIWQRASDLMAQVPSSHSRYQEARIRTKLYKEYSIAADKEAEKINSENKL